MKDDRGLYYYPNPLNKKFRMYIREIDGDVCFRLWNADDENLWEEHGWVPYDAVKQAATMFSGKDFNPNQAYDLGIARELLESAEQ